MPNKQDESPVPETPRYADRKHSFFDEDTDEAIVLPKPRPEITEDDGDVEEKKADAALDDLEIDDLEIEADEDEVKADRQSQPPGRKY
jgi:hypothetical protein